MDIVGEEKGYCQGSSKEEINMRITIAKASELIGLSRLSLQCGLRENKLPFGTAWKNKGSSVYTYLIYPAKFAEYLGISVEELEERARG